MLGQVFNPDVGFALVGNTSNGLKYPYNPFYGEFSPRIAAAWNPRFDRIRAGQVFGHDSTVVRGGYGRIYGRLNGVDLVLVPLLGYWPDPAGAVPGPNIEPGACGASDINTAFRIGVDGTAAPLAAATPTLPQPVYPGINNCFCWRGRSARS